MIEKVGSWIFWPLFYSFYGYYAVTMVLFIYQRNHPVIRQRQFLAMLLITAHGLLSSPFLFSALRLNYYWGCMANLCGYYFAGIPYMALLGLRCGNLFFVFFLHNATGEGRSKFLNGFNRWEMFLFRFMSRFQQLEQTERPSVSNRSAVKNPQGSTTTEDTILNGHYSKTLSPWGILKVVAVFHVLATLLTLISYFGLTGPLVYYCQTKDLILYSPFAVVMMYIINPYLLFTIRKVEDTLGLKRELQISLFSFTLFYTLSFLSVDLVPSLQPGFNASIWTLLHLLVQHTALVTVPCIYTFLPSPKQISHTADSFKTVLQDPKLRENFRKILAKDFCTENLIFWEAVERMKRKESGMKVADFLQKFFKAGGEFELNLPSKMVKEVRAKLLSETEDKVQVLVETQDYVVDMMYQNNFRHYLDLYNTTSQSQGSQSSPSQISVKK
jgi:hypothetical protein